MTPRGSQPHVLRDAEGAAVVASPRALTPAPRPEALLVPPLSGVAAVAATAFVADVLVSGASPAAAAARATVVALPLVAVSAVATLWARSRASRNVAAGIAAGLVVLGLGLALLAGGAPAMSPAAAVVAAVAAFAAPGLWRRWQSRWLERRHERVSLLAPSTYVANEALARLDAVPWIRVASVLVPGVDAEIASGLLQRPVATAVRGGPRLERRVVVSCPARDAAVGGAIAQLVARGHELTSESATIRTAEGRVDSARADPLNLLLGRPRSHVAEAASRALDVALSASLLLLASPLLLALAVAIVLDDGFPVLYRQRRVGAGGKPFDVVKFRSMRRDAERLSGPVWATEDDPRVTRMGRFLRRYRLDELPQLWNVLVGQMALVGPRPERQHFCDVLRHTVPLFELRTIVRPGITGWAQVRLAYGASADDAREKLEYDLYYVTRRSPWLDLAILVETARVVLTGAGSR